MLSLAKFVKKEMELRQNIVGSGFMDPPQQTQDKKTTLKKEKLPNPQRVTVVGELQSIEGFEHDKGYVMTQIFMPEDWSFEDFNDYDTLGGSWENTSEVNRRKSVTQVSQATVEQVDGEKVNVSHFCFPLEFQFIQDDYGVARMGANSPYLLL
jgi:hypothetical protein